MVKPTNANSEIEVINDGTMIKFKDVESYENALLKVSAMSTSEQVSFLNSLSFKSQMILMQEADGELDKICNQAADKAEFDVLYEKYKHKYGDVFMFNTIDATDLSPYSRLVYVANEYFVNMKGEFMIGDSLVVDKVYTDFKERQQQFTVSTRSSVSDLSSINEAYSRQKDRKVGLYLSVSSGIIHANFTSQKKGVFGWSRYSTTYHAKVNLRGFEFAQGELLGYGPVYVNKDGIPFAIDTKEMGGNVTKVFGRKLAQECTGTIEIWSRGVPYDQRGFATEFVSDSPYRYYILRSIRIGFDLFTDLTNKSHNIAVIHQIFSIPHSLIDLFLCKDFPTIARKKQKDIKFLRRERNLCSVLLHLARFRINFQRTAADDRMIPHR